ncbi:GntR family transcriptional regulator [Streptomyces sioyaensis]|uniref:GntR family transcriptional regulator n=1 Tax=Streptomyces sioyaensis TaxID=67364 RepID=UPI003D74EDD1
MSQEMKAADRAYREIKERILSGRLPGGDLVSENEMAGQLGTSRTPVREALQRLQTEGWMRLYPKRGALIVPVPPHEAQHVAQARYVVETGAVRALTEPARAALLIGLRASLERQRGLAAADDLDELAIVCVDFHSEIVAAADNPLLTSFYGSLRDRQRRMNSLALHRADISIDRLAEQHTRLADLIEGSDADGFAAALTQHLTAVHGVTVRGLG